MSDIEINQVLSQIRAMTSMAQGNPAGAAGAGQEAGRPDFAGLLQDSVNKVNEMQKTAGALATAFEAEDPGVDLAQVMIAKEKAGLAFQALTQVRNKLISAYQDIMNMPV
jgi:flagellar hook-basal body complex protein FliE